MLISKKDWNEINELLQTIKFDYRDRFSTMSLPLQSKIAKVEELLEGARDTWKKKTIVWTEDMESFLRSQWGNLTAARIAAFLQIGEETVRRKAKVLKLVVARKIPSIIEKKDRRCSYAVVCIRTNGKRRIHYLGRWGDPNVEQEYKYILKESGF